MRKDKLQTMCSTPLEIEANGKTYKLSPLTLESYSEMEAWAMQQPFKEAEQKLAAISDKKLRARMEEKLMARAMEQSESESYIREKLNSAGAVMRTFLLMLKPNHPDATDETVRKLADVNGLLQIKKWVEDLIERGSVARKNS